VDLASSSPPFYAGEQQIRVKKVRPPSKSWTPPENPQPKQEKEKEEVQKKEEVQEKTTEKKPSPKTEAGKMQYGLASVRLTSRNFPGASGQDTARGGKDLALLGVCVLAGEEREKGLSFGKWDLKARQWEAVASQPRGEREGTSNETKGFLLCLCWSVG